jgi:hypothetical protein
MQGTVENVVRSLQFKREYPGQIRSRYRRAGAGIKSKIPDKYHQRALAVCAKRWFAFGK